jgi:hypothetical protein
MFYHQIIVINYLFLVIPVDSYHPDNFANPEEKDETLKIVMDILNQIESVEDVRELLVTKFNLRQIAINSKLL